MIMNNNPFFMSSFASMIERYIEHKKTCGYKFETGEYEIRQFDAFAAALPIASGVLSKELVEAYIELRPGEKHSTQSHRISTIRCFGKYLVRCGLDAYVLPRGVLSVIKYGFVPHIFSRKDVVRLIAAADSLPYRANAPRRHIVIPMMFRLIYGCGLRISEAINLKIEDVDICTGVICIHGAKFNKDRYVPMAQSLLEKCRIYASKVVTSNSNTGLPFLPAPSGGFYNKSTIGHAFRQCLALAGIPHYDDGPTVHSLRHSFACHCLVKWGNEGKDINAMLPYLSAYMGHENLLGTERYLRVTKEILPEVRGRITAGCSWLMPEVTCHDD
jgi:integrase